MNTKLKLILVFLGGVITTLLVIFLFKEYFLEILVYLILRDNMVVM